MRKALLLTVILLGLLAGSLTSCFDPEPGEISVMAYENGRKQPCTVQLYNSKDQQIREEGSDFGGLTYITDVPPGSYTLRFIDTNRNPFAAEVSLTVEAGESVPLQVELTNPDGSRGS